MTITINPTLAQIAWVLLGAMWAWIAWFSYRRVTRQPSWNSFGGGSDDYFAAWQAISVGMFVTIIFLAIKLGVS